MGARDCSEGSFVRFAKQRSTSLRRVTSLVLRRERLSLSLSLSLSFSRIHNMLLYKLYRHVVNWGSLAFVMPA